MLNNLEKEDIHSDQLHEIQLWTSLFRKDHTNENEIVLFDIVVGDFNIDNMSPGNQ